MFSRLGQLLEPLSAEVASAGIRQPRNAGNHRIFRKRRGSSSFLKKRTKELLILLSLAALKKWNRVALDA